MTNQTPPLADARAIETNVAAIEAAMRRLTTLAVMEEQKLLDADGNPPILPDTEIGRIIVNPVGKACRFTWQKLLRLLALLIGEQAAIDTQNRINTEIPRPNGVTAKQIVFPSVVQQ